MSLSSHRSLNSSFKTVMAGLPSVAFSAVSLSHQPVPAGTSPFSCGLVPLHVGLPSACSGSCFSSCPVVTSQHHRKKKILTIRLVLQLKKLPRRHVCWFLNFEFKGKGFCLCFSFPPSEELRRIAGKKRSMLLLSQKHTNVWPLPAQLLSCYYWQSRVKLETLLQRKMQWGNFHSTVNVVIFPRAKWEVTVYFSLVWPKWPTKKETDTFWGSVWHRIPLASVAEVPQPPASLSWTKFLVVQGFLSSSPVVLLVE